MSDVLIVLWKYFVCFLIEFNAILTAKFISCNQWHIFAFPSFLIRLLTQLFFPKPLTNFLTCIGGERQKLARKNVWSNRESNLHSLGTSQIHLKLSYLAWRLQIYFQDEQVYNVILVSLDLFHKLFITQKQPFTTYGKKPFSSIFSFSHNVFYPSQNKFHFFGQI